MLNDRDSVHPPDQESAVVSGGEPHNWFRELWYKIWPSGAGVRHRLAVTGIGVCGLALLAVAGVWAYHGLNPTAPQSAVATGQKAGTSANNAQKPGDTQTPAQNQTTQLTTPAANTPGGSHGSGGSSGGGSSSGGTGGGSTSSCALPKYPNASCTGVPAGTSLTVHNGDWTITAANTVIDAQDIRGCVEVDAPGVVIKRSKISADCFYVIYSHQTSGTPLTVQDSEIDCQNHNGTAVGDLNITVLRSNIHGCENGFDVDGNLTVQDSYIHDLTQTGADPHTDGIQITPVGHDIHIVHNTIYAFTNGVDGTSAIIEPDADLTNVWIQDNLVAGGAYTIYCRANDKSYPSSWHMLNNHFSTIEHATVGAYGPMTDCLGEPNVSGNVYHETGDLVQLQ